MDSIIVVGEPSNSVVADDGESAAVISQRQLAVRALLKCELHEAEKKSKAKPRLLNAISAAGADVVPTD